MTNRKMVPMSSIIKSISMGPFGSDVKVEYNSKCNAGNI